MGGPYRADNLKVTIITNTNVTYNLGCISGMDIDLGYEGGAEPCYGSRNKSIGAGAKKISFSLSRWFYSDVSYEDLLINLVDDEIEFTIRTSLVDKNGIEIPNTVVELTGCKALGYKPSTGGADDIIGETITGLGTDWDFTGFAPTVRTDVKATKELDITGWNAQPKVEIPFVYNAYYISVDENGVISVTDNNGGSFFINGTNIDETPNYGDEGNYEINIGGTNPRFSVMLTYHLMRNYDDENNVFVWKNNLYFATLEPNVTPIGEIDSIDDRFAAISPSGKYIALMWVEIYNGWQKSRYVQLFIGT